LSGVFQSETQMGSINYGQYPRPVDQLETDSEEEQLNIHAVYSLPTFHLHIVYTRACYYYTADSWGTRTGDYI